MENVGQKIRKRREELGLKVYEVAEKVGVNPVYITQIEKHGKLPSFEVFDNIVRVLRLGPSYRELYIKEKWPKLNITKKRKPVKYESEKTTDFRDYFMDYVINDSSTDYRAFAIGLLSEFKPSEVQNEKLIDEIIDSVKKIRKKENEAQEEYRKEEDKFVKLINP